jgi:hypothetical protein
LHEPYLDPLTNEWVFADGTRLPMIAGGQMVTDELRNRGQGGGDGGEDEGDEGGTDDGDDGDDEDDGDYEAPSKADWERMQSALKNLRREKKQQKRDFEERIANMSTEGTAAAQVEIEKAKIETERRVTKFWTTRAIRSDAKAMLTAAGATESNAERLSRMVDTEKIEYDEKADEFDGLDDEVEEIIADNPEFFRKAAAKDEERQPAIRRTRPTSEAASRGSRGGNNAGRKLTSAERLAAGVLGRQPRRR